MDLTPKVTTLQGEFNALAGELGRQYPDRARLWFAYDEPLSHLIYAGKPPRGCAGSSCVCVLAPMLPSCLH